MSFFRSQDPVTCNITLIPSPKFYNKNKNRNKKEIKNNQSPLSSTLTTLAYSKRPCMSELKIVNSNYFSFSFSFLFWKLRIRISMMSNNHIAHNSVTFMVT